MNLRTPSDIGNLIARARKQLAYTQAELAQRAGTTQAWISEVESGKDTAQIGKVMALLQLLKIELSTSSVMRTEQRDTQLKAPQELSPLDLLLNDETLNDSAPRL